MSTVIQPTWSPKFQSLSSRTLILASFYTAILLAIPFWLKATTIERLPLPRQEVVTQEDQLPCPIRLHQSLTLLVAPDIIKPADRFAVAERIQWNLKAAGDGIVEQHKPRNHYVDGKDVKELRDEDEKKVKGLNHAACVDWDVRVGGKEERRSVPGLHYELDFVSSNDTSYNMTSTSTSRRMQLPLPATLSVNHTLGTQEASSILSSYLARLFELPYVPLYFPSDSAHLTIDESEAAFSSTTERIRAEIEQREEDRRRVPYTRNLRLVFSLINEEISTSRENADDMGRKQTSGVKGWSKKEMDTLFEKRFSPLLHALKGTQNIHTELQTTWFAPLQFQPKVLEVEREVESTNTTTSLEPPSDQESESIRDDDALKEEKEVDDLEELKEAVPSVPPNVVDRYHLIDWEDIKIFVNSGEWSLTSGAVTSPLSSVNATTIDEGAARELSSLFEQNERTLHFILYIPKPSHRPLRIAGDELLTFISEARGWLIPQWGGVSLFNLGYEEEDEQAVSSTNPVLDHLSAAELDTAFATFEKQFNSLLGLQELGLSKIADDVSLAIRLDTLTRRRIISASRDSVTTLASIVRLVDKIENLGVGQSVRDDVSRALNLLDRAKKLMQTTNFDTHTFLTSLAPLSPLQTLLELTHSSELHSSRAFFNPNMLGQLYFPDEHKYAVYTPLFGPLAVPLLVAGLRLLKEKRKDQAQRQATKFLKTT